MSEPQPSGKLSPRVMMLLSSHAGPCTRACGVQPCSVTPAGQQQHLPMPSGREQHVRPLAKRAQQLRAVHLGLAPEEAHSGNVWRLVVSSTVRAHKEKLKQASLLALNRGVCPGRPWCSKCFVTC